MNLGEERSRQKLMSTLELMNLSSENDALAGRYLDPDVPEDRELLGQAKPQDFSKLGTEAKNQCRKYLGHCLKRNRRDDLGRYVRFAAAVGGSTAYYVLVQYGWNLNTVLEFLTREQAAAIRAEGIVWNVYGIKNAPSNIEAKSPEVLRDAMKLCYNKSDNAKVLLGALSLHYTKPYKPAGGVAGMLFPGGKTEREAQQKVQDTVDYIEENMLNSIPNLFTGAAPLEEELERMKAFVKNSSVKEPFPRDLFGIIRGC